MLRHTFVAFAIFAAGISVAAAETPVIAWMRTIPPVE
jgi:hypothetical protein